MNTQREGSGLLNAPINRRSFLGLLAAGAATIGVPSLLASCAQNEPLPGDSTTGGGGTPTATSDGSIAPSYQPIQYVEPDFPSVNGTLPGYTSRPELVQAYDAPPGSGVTITAAAPTWSPIPDTTGQYFTAVNDAIGNTIDLNLLSGNDIWDIAQTRLADANSLPDWFALPTWTVSGNAKFGSEIAPAVFEDLTPHLTGDNVLTYPHLANIPTEAWMNSSWENKIYAIPMPGGALDMTYFYRKDLLADKGITEVAPTTIDDLFALYKEINDPGAGRYATLNPWTALTNIAFGVQSGWTVIDGKVVHRMETDNYFDCLEFVAKCYKENLVHPDDAAGRQTFLDGNVYFNGDGLGGWREMVASQVGVNDSFEMDAVVPFDYKGGDPVYWRAAPASFWSFIKKGIGEEKIAAILASADFLAAPYGTTEYDLVANGVEGVHYNLGDAGEPVKTELGNTEVVPSYMFLASPPGVAADFQYPGYVESYSAYSAAAGQYIQSSPFLGINVVVPDEYRDIEAGISDLETEVQRGRASIDVMRERVDQWRKDGGDALRDYYKKILDELPA